MSSPEGRDDADALECEEGNERDEGDFEPLFDFQEHDYVPSEDAEAKRLPDDVEGIRQTGINDHGIVTMKKGDRRAEALEPATQILFAKIGRVDELERHVKSALEHLDGWEHFRVVKDLALLRRRLYAAYSDCSASVRGNDVLRYPLLEKLHSIVIPSQKEIAAGILRALDSRSVPDAFDDDVVTEISEIEAMPDDAAPLPTPIEVPVEQVKPWYKGEPPIPGLARLIGALAASALAVGAYEIYRHDEMDQSPRSGLVALDDECTAPGDSFPSDDAFVESEPEPTDEVGPLKAPFTPVYDSLVKQTTDGPDQDLRIAVANQWLIERHEIDAHDWTHIRQAHPWKEDAQALKALLDHLKSWGGFKNPLLAYEGAKTRGEAPQTISAFLTLVDKDPQLASGTALRIAREIPLIQDERINPDLQKVASAHHILNGYVEQTVPFVQNEYNAGHLTRPANVEYVVQARPQAPRINLMDRVDSIADMEDLPDLTDELEPLDELVGASGSLASLADWTLACQTDLMKKARGANRQLLPGFLADVAVGTRELATRLNTATTNSEREALVLGQKEAFFSKLTTLRKGDGPYHSAYLGKFAKEYLARLVEALPEVPEEAGVEGIKARTRKEVVATLPQGFFRAS